jgi:mannose-6-phosphate isomerase-like protein (cupin superfamily)
MRAKSARPVLPDDATAGTPIAKHNTLFSTWGEGSGSWTLLARPQLHIMQDRMPPSTSEQRHRHADTVQCYYILDGTAAVEVAGTDVVIVLSEGIELPVGAPHQIRNDGSEPVEFLVVSSQPPRHDRAELP